MDCLRRERFFLLLLSCLFSIKVTCTQEGLSYFFYQQPEYPRDCKEARDQCPSDILSGVFTIKPDGYPQPLEVYCSDGISSGGWMVIQRRIDGSITFKRNWEDYKSGFGFLSSEFWIGNEKLSYINNQAVYEMRIDIMLSNGSSFYVKYNSFRISDERSQYALVTTDGFSGNSSCVMSTCPSGMTHAGCTCQSLCSDSVGLTDCNDNCTETCEGCTNGRSYINDDCTQDCTCIDNQITCNGSYQCSPDATCTVKSGVRGCYCNDEFEGNGETCNRIKNTNFADCYDAYQAGHRTDGIYPIQPTRWNGSSFDVLCNMSFGDGGWTVFQRRIDGSTNFYRNWKAYKDGFGSVTISGDFWLGNEKLHYLTNQKSYEIRIDMVTSECSTLFEKYSSFSIDNEASSYRLSLDRGSGRTGMYFNAGQYFSTYDRDNAQCSAHNCAQKHRGGWWYAGTLPWCRLCFSSHCSNFREGSCSTACTDSNLNGDYGGENGQTIIWYKNTTDRYCNIKYADMKIRPSV